MTGLARKRTKHEHTSPLMVSFLASGCFIHRGALSRCRGSNAPLWLSLRSSAQNGVAKR